VIGKCWPRHRAIEFRKFLNQIDRAVPAELTVQLVLDNYATHKTKEIRASPFLEFQARVNAEGCEAFKVAHNDLPLTETHSQALIDWCEAELAPMTRKNLEIAWRELQAEGQLEAKSAAQEAIGKLVTSEIEIRPVMGAPTAKPTPEEAATLEKVKDDPALSDHQRKARDEKLRRAATESCLANRSHDPHSTQPANFNFVRTKFGRNFICRVAARPARQFA
jgi:hypothetical protein